MAQESNSTGLSITNDPWPKISAKMSAKSPLDKLEDKETHKRVLNYVMDRIKQSEQAMSQFYARWSVNEKKHQAYINLEDFEKKLKELNKKGDPPKLVNVTVPYNFATTSTINTYVMHSFCGRQPIFQVSANKEKYVEAAAAMETVFQYNIQHTRFIKYFYQFVNDAEIYGVGILRTRWKKEKKLRTVWRDVPVKMLGIGTGETKKERTREERITYDGNDISSVDPYMFFPDPRVPMTEVNRRGEYVFWKDYIGKHTLLTLEQQGLVKYVQRIPEMRTSDNDSEGASASSRSLVSGGEPNPGSPYGQQYARSKNFTEIFQGTVEIIPAELGLDDKRYPTKYLFTVANRAQIIQCEELDLDHDMHPVAVTEPYSMGYGFGQMGLSDYMGPIQDTLSWFLNSHMDNVRTVLNNMLIVDPSRIEMQDLKQPGPGKLIRLKRAAYGQDVNAAVKQLDVRDVTGSHVRDFELLMRMGDGMSSVNDNLRGLQDSGGRKTATEVRTSAEAGGSRLAAHCQVISAQALVDLAEQGVTNIQQLVSEEFYLTVVGDEGIAKPIRISPEMLVGDFNFPVHDGTLPIDKVAMVDVWKEVFMGVAQSPQLSSQFNVVGIFEYLAKLAGAKNLGQFKVQAQVADPAAIDKGVQAGNMVPVGGGQTPGVAGSPADRMAGAL